MAFLTEVSAGRYFRSRRPAAGIDRARWSAVAAIKAACQIAGALALIVATMAALALFDVWVWLPHLPR